MGWSFFLHFTNLCITERHVFSLTPTLLKTLGCHFFLSYTTSITLLHSCTTCKMLFLFLNHFYKAVPFLNHFYNAVPFLHHLYNTVTLLPHFYNAVSCCCSSVMLWQVRLTFYLSFRLSASNSPVSMSNLCTFVTGN